MQVNPVALYRASQRALKKARSTRQYWRQKARLILEASLKLSTTDANLARRRIEEQVSAGKQAACAQLQLQRKRSYDMREQALDQVEKLAPGAKGQAFASVVKAVTAIQNNYETEIAMAEGACNAELNRLRTLLEETLETIDTNLHHAREYLNDLHTQEMANIKCSYARLRAKRRAIWINAISGKGNAIKEMLKLARYS